MSKQPAGTPVFEVGSFDPFTPAAAVLAVRGWTQGAMEDSAGRLCLTGAFRECGLAPGEWLIARAVARHRGHGETWNDAGGREMAEVLGWLGSAEPVSEAELGAVFGPEWRAVCGLVLRAAVLSPREARQLAAAGAAARAAARDAAGDAARAAARAAAGDAARDAARDAAGVAAGVAAWGAAGAITVRDLAAADHPRGWTPAAYNLLTKPWRDAVGPVHPDDGPDGMQL